ncbi:MAG: C1 family peptidase [Candidatus Binatia bacterium]
MKRLLSVSGLLLSIFLLGSSVNAIGGENKQFRVFVSETADLLFVRDSLVGAGAIIQSYTAERAFTVLIDETAAPLLSIISGVREVQEVPPPGEQIGIGTPGLGDVPPTAEEEEFVAKTFAQVTSVPPAPLAFERVLLEGSSVLLSAASIPAAVDNSASIHFPPIGSQGSQGSCTAWATCYYYNSYTQARDENINVSGGISDPVAVTFIGSPGFLYNLVNRGVDGGASTSSVVGRLNEVGCSSWKTKPYSAADHTSWPSEVSWVDALKFRTSRSNTITLTTPTGIDLLKQHLANGNIAVTRTDVYSNWHPTFRNNQNRGINNGVLFSHQGETFVGGHAMTIVGYDDNRMYNDGTTLKHGAFLVANSWGTGWGTTNTVGRVGFMWVAYDYVQAANSAFDSAYFNDDRDNYRPRVYAVAGLAHPSRGDVAYRGGIGFTTTPRFTSYYPINLAGGVLHPLDPAQRIAVDLTDGIANLNRPLDAGPLIFIDMRAFSAGGTIQSTDFFLDLDGDGTFVKVTSPDPQKGVPLAKPTFACTDIVSSGDVDDDQDVDRTDVQKIVASRGGADCASDPRDLDADGKITVLDARRAVLLCDNPNCAP